MDGKQEMVQADEERWNAMQDLLAQLSPEQMEEPALNADGWTVKDLMWHMGCWAAESARELERIRMGTYAERDYDTDEVNAGYLAEGRKLDLEAVRAEWIAARNRTLQEWAALGEVTPEAAEWFGESGAIHSDDHLPELRGFVERVG